MILKIPLEDRDRVSETGQDRRVRRRFLPGQMMVLLAIAMTVIIGFAALAVDLGLLYATRRNMQTAADAAAIAGSNALKQQCGTTSGCTCDSEAVCNSAAQDVATLNGFANGTNSVSVTVKAPASAPSPTNGVYVEANVTQPVPTYFLRALGYSTVSVSTTAIAGYDTSPNCIFVIDPSGSDTLVVSGGSTISSNCGILDESTDSKGMNVSSGSSSVAASSIGIVASTYTGTSGGASVTCSGSTTNCPQTKVAPTTDPLLYLQSQKPSAGTCVSGTNLTTATSGNGGTISQGTYCAGIKVASSPHVLNLNPGLYILTGSKGLTVSGGAVINGSDVTIYNSGTGAINISGGSTANLTAPTSGTWAGILMFQDPLNTAKATFSGGSSGNIQGAIYFPTTQMLTFSGGSSSTPESVTLDAWKITISGGSAYLGTTATGSGQTPPITTSRLYQ
jgi:Flp pilus assembly protein TadG